MILKKVEVGNKTFVVKTTKSNGYLRFSILSYKRGMTVISDNKLIEPKKFLKNKMSKIEEFSIWIGSSNEKKDVVMNRCIELFDEIIKDELGKALEDIAEKYSLKEEVIKWQQSNQ